MIRVLLADDHTVLRQALARVLGTRPDIEVVGEAATGTEVVKLAQELAPDVVLMDITMPDMDGITATSHIRDLGLPMAVLILTVHDRDEYLFQALRAGALGYVLKETDLDEVLTAVRKVAEGNVYIQPAMASKLVADFLQREHTETGDVSPRNNLSARENEVLHLIAAGYTTAQIGKELDISPNTVRTHRDHIMEKLDLHNKASLIRYAVNHGLIESTE